MPWKEKIQLIKFNGGLFFGLFFALLFSALLISVEIYFLQLSRQPVGTTLFVDPTDAKIRSGSFHHPLADIESALKKIEQFPHFNKIVLAPGVYREKISLPRGVALLGGGNNQNQPLLINPFNSGTTLQLEGENSVANLKIKQGKYGVKILPRAGQINLFALEISQAKKWGVFNELNSQTEETEIRMKNCRVEENLSQGAYLQKAILRIEDSSFLRNGEEGIDLHFGMRSVIENCISAENGEGGLETELEDVQLIIRNSLFEKNGSSGANFQSAGDNSRVLVENSEFRENLDFGVRCAIHQGYRRPYFSRMVEIRNNYFTQNGLEPIDPNCRR